MRLWRNDVAAVLWLVLSGHGSASGFADLSRQALLEKIRANVLEQVRIGGNYMCVQTADRHYFRPDESVRSGCDHPLKHPDKMTEFLSDRLRLDVAVSNDHEIYSWYGQQRFRNGAIDQVITTGPITSGGFGGFLRNIFLAGGIRFVYTGHFVLDGVPEDAFDYNVPLPCSTYAITTKRGPIVVAFKGSFTVNSITLELTKLTVEVPKAPSDSKICYALSSIDYQMAHISGNDVLIPSDFDFKLENTAHLVTDSRFDYRSCRAFKGESTISYVISDDAASGPTPQVVKDPLPPNLEISVRLNTPISDRDSYTGDPVEGVLLRRIKLEHSGGTISKGAAVKGIISELEFYREPSPHYFLDILFNKIIDGNVTYPMRATLYADDPSQLFRRYGFTPRLHQSSLARDGRHFYLNKGYRSEWFTQPVESLRSQ
ncbi:MAG TPA: hypothetical protein VHZ07_28420 [Bryobacteraceae bacterium]|jgi:hypothetical protein|nr:hypothetical protein [Bryobacteraceae bacterium]